jgi:hypothetical protein
MFTSVIHILNNKHEYGPIQTNMQIIKTWNKDWYMNGLGNLYIQQYQLQESLTDKQNTVKINPLFTLIYDWSA